MRVPVDRKRQVSESTLSQPLQRLHGQAFSRAPGARPPFCLGLHLDQDVPAFAGLAGAGAAARGTSPQAVAPWPMAGMMLHQPFGRLRRFAARIQLGGRALDLIVTLDDATSAVLSAFLVEEEGTASTFRALDEVFGRYGLPLSLYTDRGSSLFSHAGGRREGGSRPRLTQVGRALGVEHIAAYSPQARGRLERVFHTLQDRLTKELALAGIATIEAANMPSSGMSMFRPTMALRGRGRTGRRGFRYQSWRRSWRDSLHPRRTPRRQR